MDRIEHVFVDMDGVLADFVSSAMAVFGAKFDKSRWPAKEWCVAKVLGITLGEFWNGIDKDSHFWEFLRPYEWAGELLSLASSVAPVKLLSSPSRSPNCHAGKRRWVDMNCQDYELMLVDSKSKHLLAAPNRLLIDDSDDNVRRWREAGGRAILFPQPWNEDCAIALEGASMMTIQSSLLYILTEARLARLAIKDADPRQPGPLPPDGPVSRRPIGVEQRKARPVCTGVLDYFPDALLEVAALSRKGNDQHNPGQPLHWDKSKSTDEADALLRHLMDRGTRDTDGMRHSAKVAWRGLALLQRELDAEFCTGK